MKEERTLPTLDDLCQELENTGKTEISKKINQAAMTSRLLNPLLDDSLHTETSEKIAVCRTPIISQCIVYDSTREIINIADNDNKE